jgi:N utilization substance protein A
MSSTDSAVLESLGLDQAAQPAQSRLVSARIHAASPDVALLTVDAVEPYEAVMPITEFYPHTQWKEGQSYVLEQIGEPPRPLLSAVRPELVSMLLDGYVPEVRAGLVRIMGVARAPGVRSKVAVAATDVNVDPVASCVGRSANRVRAVGQLLGGERIDIIPWHPEVATFLSNALAPAAVSRIEIRKDRAVAVAPAHQMSAAVGGAGLNAALAGQLVHLKVVVIAEGSQEEEALAANMEESQA